MCVIPAVATVVSIVVLRSVVAAAAVAVVRRSRPTNPVVLSPTRRVATSRVDSLPRKNRIRCLPMTTCNELGGYLHSTVCPKLTMIVLFFCLFVILVICNLEVFVGD